MRGTTQRDRPPERPSIHVIERIAEADGVDPVDLDPPLHDVVDTDALDRLFDSSHQDSPPRRGSVSFRYREHDVTVHADSRVLLE
ncbi:HalOD1 output domain-containing protein [Natronolimnobius baerhuensis]|uniref:Halobacterial output domain-containing protein n=1 Tax=Natronolimnobius baerhuensis TaxID=253108 RepID=A0A202E4C9_9EURY|nr:HalOD1 output domain-containing protein [Natronolimnobius baerhuensis]OVE83089.1 hypothetical protein B2G88_16885 [Natronolimnobius baerhuensis]